MEATMAQSLQVSNFIYFEKPARRPSGSMPVSRTLKDQRKLPALVSARFPSKRVSNQQGNVALDVSCSYKSFPGICREVTARTFRIDSLDISLLGSVVESETHYAPFDEDLLLKKKSEEVEPYLSGRCIYLVGMMGSGKTTVGKVLSQVLGYSFRDSDTLVEQEVDGTTVAEIFKLHGEGFFRNKETEVLKKLSLMRRLVVSTGGGVVIRPINWKYMHKGVSVWLDVPLEALARRIAKVGTCSRPLLPKDTEDVYTETFTRLSCLLEERGKAYDNATVKVSLENIAAKLGQRDVVDITPTAIAIEALEQIAVFLREKEGHNAF